jgi:hypothetical protein
LTQSLTRPDAYRPVLQACLYIILAIDLETLAELDIGPSDEFLQKGLALEQRELPQIVAITPVFLALGVARDCQVGAKRRDAAPQPYGAAPWALQPYAAAERLALRPQVWK